MQKIVIALIIAILILLVGSIGCKDYNKLVKIEEQVNADWAQVENQLQRRADLIPNLVSTVKGYASHEREVFEQIASARTALLGARSIDEKIKASNQMESAIGRLLVVVENYPNLKADATFTRLMDELSGTENRLAVERMRYNEIVKTYNTMTRKIPTVFTARAFGFPASKSYFEASPVSKIAPKVEF